MWRGCDFSSPLKLWLRTEPDVLLPPQGWFRYSAACIAECEYIHVSVDIKPIKKKIKKDEQIEKRVTHADKYAQSGTHTKYPHVHPHTHTVTHTHNVSLVASKVGLLDTPQMDYLYSVQLKSLSVSLKAKSRMNQ